MTERLRDIAVVGDGLAGWTTAAALARRLPGARVALSPPAHPRRSVLDLAGVATPDARAFLAELRVDEPSFVRRTGAGFRLGSSIRGWSARAFFQPYDQHGTAHGGLPFHQLWLRAPDPAAFHLFSVAAEAALAGRFAPCPDEASPPVPYGLHFDPAAAAALMREAAVSAGVAQTPPCVAAECEAEARAVLRLASGAAFRPHLIVDATADGRIAAVLDDARDAWAAWLPCDRILAADRPDAHAAPPHDTLVATAAGWQLAIPRPGATAHVLAYASAHLDDDRAAAAFRAAVGVEPSLPGQAVATGRRRRAWTGNVVAVGEAAVTVDPVEGMPLQLLHAHLRRMMALLPDRDLAAVELGEYNRQMALEGDRVRDFLHLRHHLSARREPFWRDAARVAPPAALAYDVALFRERGRLPVHDEDPFDRDAWLATLLGMGVRPRRTDALAAAVDPATAARLLRDARREIAATVAAMPPHADGRGRFAAAAPAA